MDDGISRHGDSAVADAVLDRENCAYREYQDALNYLGRDVLAGIRTNLDPGIASPYAVDAAITARYAYHEAAADRAGVMPLCRTAA